MTRAPAVPLDMTQGQRVALEALARAQGAPHRQVQRAKALLMAADGRANSGIAEDLELTVTTVRSWRERFAAEGLAKLGEVRKGRGRKPSISAEKVAEIVELTLHSKPDGHTHWSCRTMAAKAGVSPATVQRIWDSRGLKPHRVDVFKLSNDPQFEDKLIDVVGLYLNPPDKAVVLCMDDKSQVQALDRTQPSLPMIRGRAGTNKRNGTTTLFAALDVATGKVFGQCLPKHRHEEFLVFLRTIDRNVPKGLQVHLILDNYQTHTHPDTVKWLSKHKRFHLHFTPTSSSWLNLVERFFRELTDKNIRRGSFPSVPDLIASIEDHLRVTTDQPKPLVWTATADSILEKVRHGRVTLENVVNQSANTETRH